MTRKTSRSWEGESLDGLRERWDRPHVHLYSSIDSTNSRARELADEGAPAGTLVLADEQVAGQGRRDRGWHSPKGDGLYMSLVMRPEALPNPPLISLLAGLGMARAVDRVLGDGSAAVKWPNDLILENRKAGGVRVDLATEGDRPAYVVLGIGINVKGNPADFPARLRDVATTIEAAAGRPVSRLELADEVLREVEDRCAQPPTALDGEQLRLLDDYDWLRDKRCRVAQDEEEEPVEGVAVGIAPDGALLFRPDSGALQRLRSGHVIVDELPLPDY